MGNSQDTPKPGQSQSFIAEKISQSTYKQIKAIYLDEGLLPVCGIYAVGVECK